VVEVTRQLQLFLSVVAGVLASFLGGWDKPLEVFAVVSVVDALLGTLLAIVAGNFTWQKAVDGASGKVKHLLLIGVAAALDGLAVYYMQQVGFSGLTNFPLHEIACVYYIISEAGSIIKLVGDVPSAIPDFLDKLRSLIGENAK
jgi:phage-related holin